MRCIKNHYAYYRGVTRFNSKAPCPMTDPRKIIPITGPDSQYGPWGIRIPASEGLPHGATQYFASRKEAEDYMSDTGEGFAICIHCGKGVGESGDNECYGAKDGMHDWRNSREQTERKPRED